MPGFELLAALKLLVPDPISVPRHLVPELVVQGGFNRPASRSPYRFGAEEVAKSRQGLHHWDSLDLVSVGCVTERVSVRPDGVRLNRIGGFGLRPLQPRTYMEPREVAVQLLDLSHQVMVEPRDFDPSVAQPELAPPKDVVVWVENADDNALDATLNDAFHAWELCTSPEEKGAAVGP